MAEKNLKINGVTYSGVEKLKVPLASDPSKVAEFVNTDDATAVSASVKDGDTFYAGGVKVEGSMPIIPGTKREIVRKDDEVTINKGYHDGTGKVKISDMEKELIVPENIRSGVTILGVGGTMSPNEGMKSQSKTVTPTKEQQVVTPDSGYNALSQVTVDAIPAEYITTTDATAAAKDIASGKTAYVNGKKVTGTHTDPAFALTDGVLTIV